MALATRCPHCHTTFRVAHDQLKLRGGIVRCGACNEIFDGNSALTDLSMIAPHAASAPAARFDSAPEVMPEVVHARKQEHEHAHPAESEFILELDLDLTSDPHPITQGNRADNLTDTSNHNHGPEPEAALPTDPASTPTTVRADVPAPVPEVEAEADPRPESEFDFELDLMLEADAEQVQVPTFELDFVDMNAASLHAPTAAGPQERIEPVFEALVPTPVQLDSAAPLSGANPAQPNAVEDAAPSSHGDADADEPGFVKRQRRQQQQRRWRGMALGAGVLVLLCTLMAQSIMLFRNELAAWHSPLKPALDAACAPLGCRVELLTRIDVLSIETGDFQPMGGNAYVLSTSLRNASTSTQAWPHVELTLIDEHDKPLLRRAFAPHDYLPSGVAEAKGFARRSEQAVKLYFALHQMKASGYTISVFYP